MKWEIGGRCLASLAVKMKILADLKQPELELEKEQAAQKEYQYILKKIE